MKEYPSLSCCVHRRWFCSNRFFFCNLFKPLFHIQSCLKNSHSVCLCVFYLFRMTLGKTVVRMVNLGRISYGQALQVQQKHVRQHLERRSECESEIPNTLLLCEHQPVYTIGIRQAPYPPEEEARLKGLGAEFFRTNRGGLITFHGPGQLVCYPILNLGCFKKSVRWYVCELEKTVIALCSKFGIKAATSPDTGVWVGDNKICAIGESPRWVGCKNIGSMLHSFYFIYLLFYQAKSH